MSVEHMVAVVAVNELDVSRAWYERLFGRPEDNRPMEILVPWRATDSRRVQATGSC